MEEYKWKQSGHLQIYGTIIMKYPGNAMKKGIPLELELLRTLAEAENDVANGRVAPMQNTFDDLRKSLLERRSHEV